MNHPTLSTRNDTGILSLADLFRLDRVPRKSEPKRSPAPDPAPKGDHRESRVEVTCAIRAGGAGLPAHKTKAGSSWVCSTTTSASGAARMS